MYSSSGGSSGSNSNNNNSSVNNNNNNNNNNNSITLSPETPQEINRRDDVRQWCEAFEKHELVEILVDISANDSQFQSYLGHAFVTDPKWCRIRATYQTNDPDNNNNNTMTSTTTIPTTITTTSTTTTTPITIINNNNNNSFDNVLNFPTEHELMEYFNRFGEIHDIDMTNSTNLKNPNCLITYKDYNSAQNAVSTRIHEFYITRTHGNSHRQLIKLCCCYAFENPWHLMSSASSSSSSSSASSSSSSLSSSSLSLSSSSSSNYGAIDSSDKKFGSNNEMITTNEPLEKRRIFVSSLSYGTNDETLINVYSQYGELEDCVIVRDKATGRSRGYGFIVFKTVQGANNALEQAEKIIDGRRTRAWLASDGTKQKQHPHQQHQHQQLHQLQHQQPHQHHHHHHQHQQHQQHQQPLLNFNRAQFQSQFNGLL